MQRQWQEAQLKASTDAAQQAADIEQKVTTGIQHSLKGAHDHTLGVVSTQVEAHEKQMQ